jgi:hypothetical protein
MIKPHYVMINPHHVMIKLSLHDVCL